MKRMETVQKKIGENIFYIRKFPAFAAANVSAELTATVMPVLGGIAPLLKVFWGDNGVTDVNAVLNADIETVMPSVVESLSSISGDKLERLMSKLLIDHRNVSMSGEATGGETMQLDRDLADEVFCGDIEEMFILCFEVVKLNFSGFFKKIGTLFGNQIGTTQTVPKSPDTESSTTNNSADSN